MSTIYMYFQIIIFESYFKKIIYLEFLKLNYLYFYLHIYTIFYIFNFDLNYKFYQVPWLY